MAKLKLQPEPTFKAKVGIAVAGGRPVEVEFIYKHRTRADTLAWLDAKADAQDVETIMDCACGWELDDQFTAENVGLLCQNYGGAGFAIVNTYLEELRGARSKN